MEEIFFFPGNVSNADVLWNNILNQNIKYGPHIRICDTTFFHVDKRKIH